MTTAFQREVRDYIRDAYPGVTGLRLEVGGKHPYLSFTYRGAKHRITVAGTPSDTDAFRIKVGDIHRTLGVPPVRTNGHRRPSRNLEEMTKEMTIAAQQQLARHLPAEPPSLTTPAAGSAWSVDGPAGVRFNASQKLVTVQVPDDVFEAFNRVSEDKRVAVVMTASNPLRLEISYDPARKARFAKVGLRWQVQAGAKDMAFLGDFALTAARATFANGKIVVTTTEALRLRPPRIRLNISSVDVSTLPPAHMVRPPAAAEFLGISLQALQSLRAMKVGPPFVRLGTRTVGYRASELRTYKEEAETTLARRLSSRAAFEEKLEQHLHKVDAPAVPDLSVRAAEAAGIVVTSNTDDLHALLTNLTRVERETPYRLVKLNDGSWAFRAPTIKL